MVSKPLVVAVDFALFHHEEHALGDANIAQRIARHGDDIGELSGMQCSQFVRQPEELRVERSPGPQRVDRLEAVANQLAELLGGRA